MKRKTLIFGALAVVLVLVLVIRFGLGDEGVYELAQNHTHVVTNNGTIDLSEGVLIGGNPQEYIVLTQETSLNTTDGEVIFTNGTKIDCNPPPGYPNPCELS